MVVTFAPYDAADFLDSDEVIFAYLVEVFNRGEPKHIASALESSLRAKERRAPSDKKSDFSSLLERLHGEGENVTLATAIEVLRAVGCELTVQPLA